MRQKPLQNLLSIFHHLLITSLLLIELSALTSCQPLDFKVGFIYDPRSPSGMIASTTIPMALDDFYAMYPYSTKRVSLERRISPGGDIVTSASAALELITEEKVHAILGPGTTPELNFVAEMGTRAKVPIISYSATSPTVSHSDFPFFIRATANDTIQTGAIAALVKAFGWRRVVPIYQDDDYGSSLLPYLVEALDIVDVEMPYRQPIGLSASRDEIIAILRELQTEQTRVFFVHMRVLLASKVFEVAADIGMMSEGYVWILTDQLTSQLSWIQANISPRSIKGTLGLTNYYPTTEQLINFKSKWARQFLNDHPQVDTAVVQDINRYVIWAYDAAWAVALAAENMKQIDNQFVNTTYGSTDLSRLGSSETGEELLQTILNTPFVDGLGIQFKLVNGELDLSEFYIINVNDQKGSTLIGYYTPRYGLTRSLSVQSNAPYSTSQNNLGPVIWPGESTVQPNGWVDPTVSLKKLRIAIPGSAQEGFNILVDVRTDNATNQTTVTGYVIEMFEAAVKKLPYALPFKYILVQNVSYDNLAEMAGNGTYDAVVADMTITYNRSKFADFTLPYMSSGLSMVVPVRNERIKNAWIFFRPLKLDLWLGSLAFFIFTGVTIWALEHNMNEEFRGPPSNQVGTVFYFTFSTLVFSHRETLLNNLSRFAIIVWVFVVLILQSSYTASLTSTLTVQHLTPTFSDMNELLKSEKKIGYLSDSTKNFLMRSNFTESRLVPFSSPDAYEDALSNYSIAAVVDETPHLWVFLNKYCDNHTMVNLLNKTGGFGFVFPIGSSIVPDLSRAILNITEGDEGRRIMQKWFGEPPSCPPQDAPSSPQSLDIISFWGLFLITGVTSVACCLIQLVMFLWQERHHIRQITSRNSFRSSLRSITKLYDGRDLSSHTFRGMQPSSPNSSSAPATPMSTLSNQSSRGLLSSRRVSPVTAEAELCAN